MKILFVHTYYKEKGGEDQVFVNELKLLQTSFTVQSISFKNPDNSFLAILKFIISPFNIFAFYTFVKVIRKLRPDIIHIHNWHFAASPMIFVAARFFAIPVVHTLHNYRLLCPSSTLFVDGNIFLDSLNKLFPLRAISKHVYRGSFFQTFWLAFITRIHYFLGTWRNVDQFIALTPFAKNLFLNSYLKLTDDQISVKPNFVLDFGNSDRKRDGHFLFIGRLTEEKGIRVLLEAFANSIHTLHIIGDGPLKDLVCDAQSKNSNIIYKGYIPNIEITQSMRNATALIFPSIWFEGMPMTLLEAFSTGTPIIASNLGAMSSMIKHEYSGLLFDPNIKDDLNCKISQWYNFSSATKLMYSKNSRKTYEEHYTPELNINLIKDIYSLILQKKSFSHSS